MSRAPKSQTKGRNKIANLIAFTHTKQKKYRANYERLYHQ